MIKKLDEDPRTEEQKFADKRVRESAEARKELKEKFGLDISTQEVLELHKTVETPRIFLGADPPPTVGGLLCPQDGVAPEMIFVMEQQVLENAKDLMKAGELPNVELVVQSYMRTDLLPAPLARFCRDHLTATGCKDPEGT